MCVCVCVSSFLASVCVCVCVVEAPPRILPAASAPRADRLRPQQPLRGEGAAGAPPGAGDGSFVMQFEDFLQVFGHIFVSRPLSERGGWASLHLRGRWTPETLGGTPIAVKAAAPPGTAESWARNPQCRLVLPAGEGQSKAGSIEARSAKQRGTHADRQTARTRAPFTHRDMHPLLLCVRLDEKPCARVQQIKPAKRDVITCATRAEPRSTQSCCKAHALTTTTKKWAAMHGE